MELTYTQAKSIIESCGRDELEDFLAAMDNQPEFLEYMGEIDDLPEIASILQGGCESGAYMPAVTYHTARQCMILHNDSVEEWAGRICETPIEFNPASDSFSGFCTKLCCLAVESWCYRWESIIEAVEGNY